MSKNDRSRPLGSVPQATRRRNDVPARRESARTYRLSCAALVLGALSVYFGCACGGEVGFGGQQARKVEVKPVSHYGLTLDATASPEQVAFVALRAIREDVQAKNAADRQTAVDVQFDVAAANVIAKKNKTKLQNDEYIHEVVYHWAPTIAHYAADLPATWEDAQSRLVRRAEGTDAQDASTMELAMELADPSGNPNARVVLLIWLAKDNGLWRVLHFGFDQGRRSLAQGPKPTGPAAP